MNPTQFLQHLVDTKAQYEAELEEYTQQCIEVLHGSFFKQLDELAKHLVVASFWNRLSIIPEQTTISAPSKKILGMFKGMTVDLERVFHVVQQNLINLGWF
jgi:hypothetical protein